MENGLLVKKKEEPMPVDSAPRWRTEPKNFLAFYRPRDDGESSILRTFPLVERARPLYAKFDRTSAVVR